MQNSKQVKYFAEDHGPLWEQLQSVFHELEAQIDGHEERRISLTISPRGGSRMTCYEAQVGPVGYVEPAHTWRFWSTGKPPHGKKVFIVSRSFIKMQGEPDPVALRWQKR